MKQLLSILSSFIFIAGNAQTYNKNILDSIKYYAKKNNSSDIAVWVDGKPILNEKFDQPFQAVNIMSATKSFANLAIGILIHEGKIKSIDVPVRTFFTERKDWDTGFKNKITLRHILNHTSGIEIIPTGKIYKYGNCVEFALNSNVKFEPGSKFQYNNNAINIISGIVKKITGMTFHNYLKEKLFQPLGIKNTEWSTDVYMKALVDKTYSDSVFEKKSSELMQKGNNFSMDGLVISAEDLVKVGLLLANNGKLKDKQLVGKEWLKFSCQAGQKSLKTYGYSWWLIPDPKTYYISIGDNNIEMAKKAGATDSLIQMMTDIKGNYKNMDSLINFVERSKFGKLLGEYYLYRSCRKNYRI
jgi:CubicO group peptidase (beta-lactamase class C family)